MKNIISNIIVTIIVSFIVSYFTFPFVEENCFSNNNEAIKKFNTKLSINKEQDKENDTLILMAKTYCKSQNQELVDVRISPFTLYSRDFLCSNYNVWLSEKDISFKYRFYISKH